MKILLINSNFDYLSGCPLYVYELGTALTILGHDVTIASRHGGILQDKATTNGIKLQNLYSPTGVFDVIHCHQSEPTDIAIQHFPNTPKVVTLHSEFTYEIPTSQRDKIQEWIAIRPSIAELYKELAPTVIYNPFDTTRYKATECPTANGILFCGTIDPLRKQSAFKAIDYASSNNMKITFMGKKFDRWADSLPVHANYIPDQWDTENVLKDYTMTAGIMLGRTTIEGLLMGKPGIYWNVDQQGNPVEEIHVKPEDFDLSIFDRIKVAEQIIEVYQRAISKTTQLSSL